MYKIALSFFTLLLFGLLSACNAAEPAEGTYKRIKPVIPTQTGDKIEVMEIFWYGCPHCYAFEPYVENWVKSLPEDVEFRRVPGVLNKNWMPHARAYFTAEKLGVMERIHIPLFEALHKQRKRIFNESELKEFFVAQGVSADEFTKTYNSQAVEIKVKKAFLAARRAGLTGVPAVIVNGKYLTSGTMTGSYENLLKVIDQLVDKERKGL